MAMPEPCKFPTLDSCQKSFLLIHEEVDHALHLVVGLVLQIGDGEKYSQAFGLESLDFLSETTSRVYVSKP